MYKNRYYMYAANQCWNMFENIQNSVLRHLGHHLVTMDQVELWDLYWVCMMMIATWDVSVSITCVASSLANQTLSACETMLQVCKRRFVTLMHDHLPHLVRVMYISVCILIYSFVVWCYMPWTLIKKCVVWLHQWRCKFHWHNLSAIVSCGIVFDALSCGGWSPSKLHAWEFRTHLSPL